METKSSLPHTQELFTFSYSEPDKATPNHPILKNAVFWDVTPRGSDKNRLFGGN
jgi:hypothetical protein